MYFYFTLSRYGCYQWHGRQDSIRSLEPSAPLIKCERGEREWLRLTPQSCQLICANRPSHPAEPHCHPYSSTVDGGVCLHESERSIEALIFDSGKQPNTCLKLSTDLCASLNWAEFKNVLKGFFWIRALGAEGLIQSTLKSVGLLISILCLKLCILMWEVTLISLGLLTWVELSKCINTCSVEPSRDSIFSLRKVNFEIPYRF